MTYEKAKQNIGSRVINIPEKEEGIITKVTNKYAFVKYSTSEWSKATLFSAIELKRKGVKGIDIKQARENINRKVLYEPQAGKIDDSGIGTIYDVDEVGIIIKIDNRTKRVRPSEISFVK
jgi:hypothetical protein